MFRMNCVIFFVVDLLTFCEGMQRVRVLYLKHALGNPVIVCTCVVRSSFLHLGHHLLQGHGLAHVAGDLQLSSHKCSGGLDLSCKHFSKVGSVDGESNIGLATSRFTSSAGTSAVLQVQVPLSIVI